MPCLRYSGFVYIGKGSILSHGSYGWFLEDSVFETEDEAKDYLVDLLARRIYDTDCDVSYEDFKNALLRMSETTIMLSKFESKEAAVEYLAKETELTFEECSNAYDIYFILKHYKGGVKALAKEFAPVSERNLVVEMKEKLKGKFASELHAGPKDVADFLDLEDEEEIDELVLDEEEEEIVPAPQVEQEETEQQVFDFNLF